MNINEFFHECLNFSITFKVSFLKANSFLNCVSAFSCNFPRTVGDLNMKRRDSCLGCSALHCSTQHNSMGGSGQRECVGEEKVERGRVSAKQ